MVHEAVEDGGAHGRIAEIFPPVLHDAVGCHDDASPQLVALVHEALEKFRAGLADAAGEEEIVEDDDCLLYTSDVADE